MSPVAVAAVRVGALLASPAREGRSSETVHPWGTGGVHANFREPDLPGPERAYYGTNYERVLAVKRRCNPDNVLRFR